MRFIKPNSENELQATFFEWIELKAKLDHRLDAVFAIPNGSNKGFAARQVFKATGLKSGVPDVFVAVPVNDHNGLFIEFKTSKGKISDSQKAWHERLQRNGYRVSVCRSLSEAIEAVESYLA